MDIRQLWEPTGCRSQFQDYYACLSNLSPPFHSGFSGGERQKIVLVRRLLQKPKILLMDEDTSALDMASEYSVKEVLRTEFGSTTTIIIAYVCCCRNMYFGDTGTNLVRRT